MFDSIRTQSQLLKIFEYLPSPIYLFDWMTMTLQLSNCVAANKVNTSIAK